MRSDPRGGLRWRLCQLKKFHSSHSGQETGPQSWGNAGLFLSVCTYVMRVLVFLRLRCSSWVSEQKTTAMSDVDYCQCSSRFSFLLNAATKRRWKQCDLLLSTSRLRKGRKKRPRSNVIQLWLCQTPALWRGGHQRRGVSNTRDTSSVHLHLLWPKIRKLNDTKWSFQRVTYAQH